ncbi:hypothetical protein [Algibacter mikhailovii]|uniref:Membrane protein n=1 Tax=Algibacter mikhailovii TaxID=425498 RepID=A0A918R622_9FLAO|nr:hypothetical protein [Algibacter mikhailovii]GGZ83638.1 membrane protein [Algibacter mikhailovii]
MIKKLVLVLIALLAIQGYSQESTASPYSFYGIGSLNFKGTVENRSMGSLSIYTDSIHVNLRNPASYGGDNLAMWGNTSRPVKFSLGGSFKKTNLKSETSKGSANSTTFNYLALAIPIGKLGFGVGIIPYTSVGYRLESLNDNGQIENRFNGEGGLNRVFLGAGYQFTKGLSLGVDFQYNFGNVQNNVIAFQYDGDVPVQYQSREINRSDLSGFSMNFGLSYKKMLNERLQLVTGLTYSPQMNLVSDNNRLFSTITINSATGREIPLNTVNANLENLGLAKTDLVIPSKFTFGLGIGQVRNWFIGAEYLFQESSKFSNVLYSTNITTYEDASTLSIGGFFIPQYNSFSNYFKRTVYRAGMRLEKTGLVINDESIKEFGITFGIGLPIGDTRLLSNANIGLELGQRGTTKSNLIEENFINVQLSLSLNDRWFQKRKFQ